MARVTQPSFARLGEQIFGKKSWPVGVRLDASEVPEDPRLPQLGTLLAPDKAMELLQMAMSGDSREPRLIISGCNISFVRHSPGRACIVSYALSIHDTASGKSAEQIVSVKAFAEDWPHHRVRRLARRMRAKPTLGPAFVYLDGLRVAVVTIPNDLRMPDLYRLFRRNRLKRILRLALHEDDIEVKRPKDAPLPVDIISYKPERSCLFRCVVLRGSAPQPRKEVVFGRLYRNEKGARVFRAMEALWQCEARRTGLLRVARPLGYDAVSHTLFQSRVPGIPLDQVVRPDELIGHSARVGISLAALHGSGFALDWQRTTGSEAEILSSNAKAAARVHGGTAQQLLRVVACLIAIVPTLPLETTTITHGDFAPTQVMVDGYKLALIDFDRVSMGAPSADIGSFLGRLEKLAMDQGLAAEHVEASAAAFRLAYEAELGVRLPNTSVHWHHVVTLVRMALSAMKHLRPGWSRRTDIYLERAEVVLRKSLVP